MSFDVEATRVKVRGKVVSGRGEGRRFVELPWATGQFREKLGFVPYPGTLNIKLEGGEALRLLGLIKKHLDGGIVITPPRGSKYCLGLCFHAKVESRQEGAIVIPLVKGYYREVVEVVAPVGLRERFKLRDGDEVGVEVEARIRRLKGFKSRNIRLRRYHFRHHRPIPSSR